MIVGFSLARVFSRFVSQELLSIDVVTVGSTFTAFLLLFVSFLISGRYNKFALSWVLLSLIPNMLSELVGYAYTVVSALGMSLFLGLVFSKAQIDREPYPKASSQNERKIKVVIASLSLLVLLLGMILKIQDVPITVEYFKYRVSTGQNEKRVLEYLSHHVPAHETVYGDRENPWLTRLRFMGKTYELGGTVSDVSYTSWMLSVLGRSDIRVKPIEDLKKVLNPEEAFIYLYDPNNLRMIEELSDAFHFNLVKQYETWDDRAMILTLVPNGKVFPK